MKTDRNSRKTSKVDDRDGFINDLLNSEFGLSQRNRSRYSHIEKIIHSDKHSVNIKHDKLRIRTRMNTTKKIQSKKTIPRLKIATRKIVDTFGPMAVDWPILALQDVFPCNEIFPEDMEEWILYRFASKQHINTDFLYGRELSFGWGESKGQYTLAMTVEFEFDQKLVNGSVVRRGGNISISDVKIIAASVWKKLRPDESDFHPVSEPGDRLYFGFILAINWSVLVEAFNNSEDVKNSSKNNAHIDDSSLSSSVRFKRNEVREIIIRVPLSLVSDWIQGRVIDANNSVADPTNGLKTRTKIKGIDCESDGKRRFLMIVPEAVPEFFRNAGRRMFYLARENGLMSSEDYEEVMTMLEPNNRHLGEGTTDERNNQIGNFASLNDHSSDLPHAERSPGSSSPYSQTINNLSSTTASLPYTATERERTLAQAVKLTQRDWKHLKLLRPFDGQTFTLSQWARVLRYAAGATSRGNAYVWLREMEQEGYVVMEVQRSKAGSKRGVRVQITNWGLAIVEAIMSLSPS